MRSLPTRVPALFTAALLCALSPGTSWADEKGPPTERWGLHELSLSGPDEGNSFVEVALEAEFTRGGETLTVPGFYDGDGEYRVRFMPPAEGSWEYVTRSSHASLDGRRGRIEVGPPSAGNQRLDPELEGTSWRFEVIDTWGATVAPVPGTFTGRFHLDLPARPGLAVRAIPVPSE